VRLSHLFFFDGEQIASLAEGEQTAEIIGTAIDGLLGLDLLERLNDDLKVYERRVREERRRSSDETRADAELRQAEAELRALEARADQVSLERGALVNAMNPLSKALHAAEERYRGAGGEFFERAQDLQRARERLTAEKRALEDQLRELLAGPLPLLLIDGLLGEVAQQARHENQIRHARTMREALEARDREVLARVEQAGIGSEAQAGALAELFASDRAERTRLALEPLLLNADEELPPRIDHLRRDRLPADAQAARELQEGIRALDERIQRLDDDLARVPTEAHIDAARKALEQARAAVAAKEAEAKLLDDTAAALTRQQAELAKRVDRLRLQGVEEGFDTDDQQRLLHHAARVRGTLGELRQRATRRHLGRIESLMLDAFRALLHKSSLVRELSIDPETYRVGLTGQDGRPLPFSRLSAGERQLLATAMLWGLARASGRPVPTIIDTPLGRLDSSHRRNLIERYFQNAAHQVLLLSTDEEIVGSYEEALHPAVARHYLLSHDTGDGTTNITDGYFARRGLVA
jgi:DNA sulfur modification protein DndD